VVPSERTPTFSDREGTPPHPPQANTGARPSDMVRGARDEAAEVGLLAAIAANRHLVHHLVECWNARDFDGYEAVLADDVDVELIPFETTLRGARTARAHAESQAVAFPDGKVVITAMRADADGTVLEFVGRGTHTGPLVTPAATIQPTGRSGELRYCFVYDIENGRIRRMRQYYDVGTMMRLLGIDVRR
jgi:steroid delta-isomerase-like uncharacterized protein